MLNKLYDHFWEQLHVITGATGRNKNQAFRDLYKEICVELKPQLFVEIGAHEAGFSKSLASLLTQTKLMAFEANPYVYERFARSMPPTVQYLNKAVGTDESPKTFDIPRVITTRDGEIKLSEHNPVSSLHKRIGAGVTSTEVSCECTTLDRIVAGSGISRNVEGVAIWIDVEGAVGDVLFGAHQSLKEDVSAILVELESRASWAGQWLAKEVNDYLALFGFVPIARDCETTWQYNQIYLKQRLVTDRMIGLVDGYIRRIVEAARRPGEKLAP